MKENIEKQVDAIFVEWDKTSSPGCALAVIKDGEIIYKRGYGMANLELGVVIRPDSVFDIGSTSKQFTAACILMLARRKQLSLDDDIRKYIPEMPDYGTPITVRNLVHHTSGIRDYLGLMMLAGMPFENDYQEDEVVALIARQKELNFKPGDEHIYCNSGYFLMSEIVHRVSGKNMRDFAEENIFGPLGMKNTHFHNDFKMIVKNRASGYSPKAEGGFVIDMGIFDVMGDGAVYTTVEDLFKWDQNFYHNILDGGGQEFIEQMQTPIALNNGEMLNYAYGLHVDHYHGLKTVDHGGAWYGYRAQLLRFPEQRYSFICLSNLGSMNPDGLVHKVADLYLKDQFKESTSQSDSSETSFIELSQEQAANLAGFYESESGSLGMLELKATEDGLVIEVVGQAMKLVAKDPFHLTSEDSSTELDITFEPGKNGKPLSGIVSVANGMMVEKIIPIQVNTLTPAELKEYCGDFYNEEVKAAQHIILQENTLQVKIMSLSPITLKPTLADKFDGGMFSLQYQRDEKGKIAGFIVQAGRVKNMAFVKIN